MIRECGLKIMPFDCSSYILRYICQSTCSQLEYGIQRPIRREAEEASGIYFLHGGKARQARDRAVVLGVRNPCGGGPVWDGGTVGRWVPGWPWSETRAWRRNYLMAWEVQFIRWYLKYLCTLWYKYVDGIQSTIFGTS